MLEAGFSTATGKEKAEQCRPDFTAV